MNPIEDKRPDERLGAYLARAREARGMSAADLATVTHLSEKNVELIEAGDWKAFPIEAYLRSYLNSISNKLGLDQKRVLDWYGAESGTRHASLLSDFAPKADKTSNPLGLEEPAKHKNFIIPIIVVIVGLAIVLAAHFARDVSKATETVAKSAPVKEAVVEESAEEPAEMPEGAIAADSLEGDSLAAVDSVAADTAKKKEPGLSQAEVDSAVKKSALPASATIFISSTSTEKEEAAEEEEAEEAAEEPAVKGVKTRLELVASGEMRTWIGIKRHEDDDKFLRESNLVKAGTRMVYKATDTVFVVIGEPRAISKMVLNGKTTKIPLAKNARVAKFNVYNGKVLK